MSFILIFKKKNSTNVYLQFFNRVPFRLTFLNEDVKQASNIMQICPKSHHKIAIEGELYKNVNKT